MTENPDEPTSVALRQWLDELEGGGFTFRVERMMSDLELAVGRGELYPTAFSWLRAAFEQGVEFERSRNGS